MARMILSQGKSWDEARQDALKVGIILTRRKHRKGGYVCYASAQLRCSLEQLQKLREMPANNILIAGAL